MSEEAQSLRVVRITLIPQSESELSVLHRHSKRIPDQLEPIIREEYGADAKIEVVEIPPPHNRQQQFQVNIYVEIEVFGTFARSAAEVFNEQYQLGELCEPILETLQDLKSQSAFRYIRFGVKAGTVILQDPQKGGPEKEDL